jgi:hypothetical protein
MIKQRHIIFAQLYLQNIDQNLLKTTKMFLKFKIWHYKAEFEILLHIFLRKEMFECMQPLCAPEPNRLPRFRHVLAQ